MTDTGEDVLRAPLTVEFPVSRTVGPAISAFLTGLREGVVVGIRTADGRVMVPPVEYDPVTSEELDELVQVGEAGEVRSWTWVNEPREEHPVDRPFAWALIALDGADTTMLHAVDAGDHASMSTGMRVAIRWAGDRQGHIRDIECFVPGEGEPAGPGLRGPNAEEVAD